MPRNVFISVLGYGNYGSCRYSHQYVDTEGATQTFVSTETRYVQTATIEYIYTSNHWDRTERLTCLFLMDEDCYHANWVNHQIRRYEPRVIDQPGLEDCLSRFTEEGYNIEYQIIHINKPSGDDQEVWDIFRNTFEALASGDSLYFDVTHSFRSHPIMIMVLNNYAKLLKEIIVRSITYGNYELRDTATCIAPIVDLTPLNELQDWTLAASTYLKTGHIEQLQQIAREALERIDRVHCSNIDRNNIRRMDTVVSLLDKMVDERLLCRGRSLIEAQTIATLREQIREDVDFGERMPVFEPIFQEIRYSLEGFDSQPNAMNTVLAARWCYNNKQYQQCITLLEEGLVCTICDYAREQGIQLNYGQQEDRKCVSTALYAFQKSLTENKWDLAEIRVQRRGAAIQKIRSLLRLDLVQDIAQTFDQIREIRNDFNHAGISPAAKDACLLRNEIKQLLEDCEEILIDRYYL